MEEFVKWLGDAKINHPAQFAAEAHFRFVSIHPFVDGNGRTARLLMNLLLMQSGYPPALIKKEDRLTYITAIEKGQLTGEMDDYYRIIYESIDNSLEIYLNAVDKKVDIRTKNPKHAQKPKKLLKIGELAKLVQETVPTIRYWTQSGLLTVAKYTPGGYQLYDEIMIESARKIRMLQKEKRLTIEEIKEEFTG